VTLDLRTFTSPSQTRSNHRRTFYPNRTGRFNRVRKQFARLLNATSTIRPFSPMSPKARTDLSSESRLPNLTPPNNLRANDVVHHSKFFTARLPRWVKLGPRAPSVTLPLRHRQRNSNGSPGTFSRAISGSPWRAFNRREMKVALNRYAVAASHALTHRHTDQGDNGEDSGGLTMASIPARSRRISAIRTSDTRSATLSFNRSGRGRRRVWHCSRAVDRATLMGPRP
jgi:hypothetical protein